MANTNSYDSRVVYLFYSALERNERIGALAAHGRNIREAALETAGVEGTSRLVIARVDDYLAFYAGMVQAGTLDSDAVELELVAVATNLVQASADIAGILLACTCRPLYDVGQGLCLATSRIRLSTDLCTGCHM